MFCTQISRSPKALPATLLTLGFGPTNRGIALLDSTVFVAAPDARLVALDARSGAVRWIAPVAGDEVGRKTSGGLQARLDTLRQLAGSSPDVSQRPAANAEGGDEKEDLLRRRNSFVARLLGRR